MNPFRYRVSVIVLGAVTLPTLLFAANYEIDTAHTSVTFKVRHLLSKVTGKFSKFSGTFTYDPAKPETWKTEATVDVQSIDTNVADRDKHLRSKDFFDVDNEKHPDYKTMTFVSTKITDIKKDKAKLHGNLTMHGVRKPVVLDLEIGGLATDPWGNKKAAFSATTTINRKDFDLTWNQTLETGGVLVGDEVEISLEVEGNLKEPTSPAADTGKPTKDKAAKK